jgi:universal stress protein E
MSTFSKTLVLTDPGSVEPTPAVVRGAELARRGGGSLTLATVVEEPAWYARLMPGAGEAHEALAGRASSRLEALAERLRGEGTTVETRVLRGKASIEAAREVRAGGHDLLLKDVAGAAPSSADLQVLRMVPCPVWMVRGGADGRAEPLRRVLAAVDPQPEPGPIEDDLHLRAHEDRKALNRTILGFASSIAGVEGAELHVVHAWDVPGEALLRGETLLAPEQIEDYVASVRDAQRGALDALLGEVAGAPEPESGRVHFRKGVASEVVGDVIGSIGADLVVLGTVARTGLPGLLLGNTCESILQRAGCSVLAVKPPGFEPGHGG